MTTSVYPKNYSNLNKQSAKKLNIVVEIQGCPFTFSIMPIYEKIRYGDPRITYGMPGLVYGGLILKANVQPWLMLDSGLNISQRIEPEQGRGSVGTITLNFIDKNGFMSQLISPGVILQDPLGNAPVTISVGYSNSSFPEDYFKIFRGYISDTQSKAGKVTLEISDPNIKRRQLSFYGGLSSLPADIDATTVTIPINDVSSFLDYVLGPDNTFDPAATCYLMIDDEYMTYAPNSIVNGGTSYIFSMPATANATVGAVYSNNGFSFTVVNTLVAGQSLLATGTGAPQSAGALTLVSGTGDATINYDLVGQQGITVLSRGGANSRGTAQAAHASGAAINNAIQLQGNVIDIALKIMLSGWAGPYQSGIACTALGTTLDVDNPNTSAILLPSGIDAVDVYGLSVGDWVTIAGSGAGNNGSFQITDIQNSLNNQNGLLIVNTTFTIENPATSVSIAIRSQYDTLPDGAKNSPNDVDVATMLYVRKIFFSSGNYTNQLFISDTQSGTSPKDLIESSLYLPAGCYTVTRYGRLSLAVTTPPIAQESLVYLDQTNVLNPANIAVSRGLNGRRFYNFVVFYFDLDDAGDYLTTAIFEDTNSETKIQVNQSLPINADGLKTPLGGAVVAAARGKAILDRFKNAAYEIDIDVMWSAASQIEVGDVIALNDNGNLKITNLETGERNLGVQLFEVIQRTLNITQGKGQLTLLSNLGYKINQRYATISPSSVVAPAGSSTTTIEIQDSFGALYPGNEKKKWSQFYGLPIVVHDPLYTRTATVVLTGFSTSDNYKMLVSPALPWVPQPGDIVDIAPYGTGTDAAYDALYKTLFAFIDPTLTVVSGISDTQFTVSSGDAAKVVPGLPVEIRSADWSTISPECVVSSVVGTTVSLKTSLGFTPTAGQRVELVGFLDGGGPYRLL